MASPDDLAAGFHVVLREQIGERVLAFHGALDLAAAQAAAEAIRYAARDGSRVVVDLAPLSFIDPSGIHVLSDAYRELGVRLRLWPGSGIVAGVLRLTGVARSLPLEPRGARTVTGAEAGSAERPRTRTRPGSGAGRTRDRLAR